MIKNINEEKLQQILEDIVLPGSSIGVHGILGKQLPYEAIANSILETGLKNAKYHKGLTGTIAFLGQKETLNYNDVLNYSYGDFDSNNNKVTIVCAIPETIKTSEGKQYYLGKYDVFEGFGKNDKNAHSMPTHDLDILPTEFIVGCVVYNRNTRCYNFIINKNYVSFKNDVEQCLVNDNLLQKIPESELLYTLDDDSYEKANNSSLLFKECGVDVDHYTELFLSRYQDLTYVTKKL